MTEEEFFSYALYIERERSYKMYWSDSVFRSHFGKWVPKKIRQQSNPVQPIEDFIALIDKNIKEWTNNNPKEIAEFEQLQAKKYLNRQKNALNAINTSLKRKKHKLKLKSEVEELIDLFFD